MREHRGATIGLEISGSEEQGGGEETAPVYPSARRKDRPRSTRSPERRLTTSPRRASSPTAAFRCSPPLLSPRPRPPRRRSRPTDRCALVHLRRSFGVCAGSHRPRSRPPRRVSREVGSRRAAKGRTSGSSRASRPVQRHERYPCVRGSGSCGPFMPRSRKRRWEQRERGGGRFNRRMQDTLLRKHTRRQHRRSP